MLKQDNRTEKRRIGDIGEETACRFLMKHGFEIIERNHWRKWGEIDIVSKKDRKLHFVEVKTVSCENLAQNLGNVSCETDQYRPEDNLHYQKLERLKRVIQSYLLDNRVSHETGWQFDVITVRLDIKNKQAKVEYIEDIIL